MSFLKKFYGKRTNEVRYLLTFIQDAGNLMSRPYKTVDFVDVSQASGGFCLIMFAYRILSGTGMQKLHINKKKILDPTCIFLERSCFPEDTFSFNNRNGKQVLTRFQGQLFCHCFQSNVGRMN